VKESENSDGLDEREKLLLIEMRENAEKSLSARHRSRLKPLDEGKVRYPTGVYGFDEVIDSSQGGC